MPYKITFLGVGGDSFTVGKQMLGSGGIIMRNEELQFHIDPGPNALAQAHKFGINLRENSVIIATHNHVNHANDINAVIEAMTYGGLDKKGVVMANSTVVNGAESAIPVLSKYHAGCVERVITLFPGKKVGIEDIEVHAIHAKHTDPNAVGIKVYTQDFVLSYTSDTKYSAEAVEDYKGSDIIILNIVNPSTEKSNNNLNSEDAVKIINKVKPRLAIITHFGIKMLKSDPLQEARDIQRQTGVQVIAAKDGLTLSPTPYSAQSRQKTLLNIEKLSSKPVVEEQEIKEEVVEEPAPDVEEEKGPSSEELLQMEDEETEPEDEEEKTFAEHEPENNDYDEEEDEDNDEEEKTEEQKPLESYTVNQAASPDSYR